MMMIIIIININAIIFSTDNTLFKAAGAPLKLGFTSSQKGPKFSLPKQNSLIKKFCPPPPSLP